MPRTAKRPRNPKEELPREAPPLPPVPAPAPAAKRQRGRSAAATAAAPVVRPLSDLPEVAGVLAETRAREAAAAAVAKTPSTSDIAALYEQGEITEALQSSGPMGLLAKASQWIATLNRASEVRLMSKPAALSFPDALAHADKHAVPAQHYITVDAADFSLVESGPFKSAGGKTYNVPPCARGASCVFVTAHMLCHRDVSDRARRPLGPYLTDEEVEVVETLGLYPKDRPCLLCARHTQDAIVTTILSAGVDMRSLNAGGVAQASCLQVIAEPTGGGRGYDPDACYQADHHVVGFPAAYAQLNLARLLVVRERGTGTATRLRVNQAPMYSAPYLARLQRQGDGGRDVVETVTEAIAQSNRYF